MLDEQPDGDVTQLVSQQAPAALAQRLGHIRSPRANSAAARSRSGTIVAIEVSPIGDTGRRFLRVSAFQDHRELEQRQRLVIGQRAEVASGALGVAMSPSRRRVG